MVMAQNGVGRGAKHNARVHTELRSLPPTDNLAGPHHPRHRDCACCAACLNGLIYRMEFPQALEPT
jgi:hypothetical protein